MDRGKLGKLQPQHAKVNFVVVLTRPLRTRVWPKLLPNSKPVAQKVSFLNKIHAFIPYAEVHTIVL